MKLYIRVLTSVLIAGGVTLTTGCAMSKPVGLGLLGYNYTDRVISSYTVTDQKGNAAWGGRVALSSHGSGGSGETCCVMLSPTETEPVQLTVDWTFERPREQWGKPDDGKEKRTGTVTVVPPYPKDPGDLEIHFYPDGHLEAQVTQYPTEPRILHPKGSPGTE